MLFKSHFGFDTFYCELLLEGTHFFAGPRTQSNTTRVRDQESDPATNNAAVGPSRQAYVPLLFVRFAVCSAIVLGADCSVSTVVSFGVPAFVVAIEAAGFSSCFAIVAFHVAAADV